MVRCPVCSKVLVAPVTAKRHLETVHGSHPIMAGGVDKVFDT